MDVNDGLLKREDDLEVRAQAFARLVCDMAMNESNVIRGMAHFDELRPLKDDDLPPGTWSREGKKPCDYISYEDTGIATGEFLSSQCLRYEVTGDAEALELARRTFDGIRFIYNLGATRQEGFFPKPYGGEISDQISRDQYLYVMMGMSAYHKIADAATRRDIERMMGCMARYWMSIDYSDSYFGLPPSSHLSDFMGSLFLGILRMAADFNGASDLDREYARLFNEEKLGPRMGETLRALFLSGKTYDGGTVFRQHENPIMMKTLALDYLWDADPGHGDTWRSALRQFWDDDMLVMLDRNDGKNYWFMGFDVERNETYVTEPGVFPGLCNPLDLSPLTWGGSRKSTSSVKTAYCAAIVADRLGIEGASDIARDILEKLDLGWFQSLSVPDSQHIPPGFEWQTHALCMCHVAGWQHTYWLGRSRGLW